MERINKFFNKKKVFITGHTGFKGSWLTSCLIKFNANICEYSLNDQIKKYFKIHD